MDCNDMNVSTGTESTESKTKELAVSKSKVNPVTYHEATEGELMYSSTLSLTSALDGVV